MSAQAWFDELCPKCQKRKADCIIALRLRVVEIMEQAREWRAIESAPTDGRHVLVVDDGTANEARFIEGSGWWLAGDHPTDAHSSQLYPTLWMPMPVPPSAGGQ